MHTKLLLAIILSAPASAKEPPLVRVNGVAITRAMVAERAWRKAAVTRETLSARPWTKPRLRSDRICEYTATAHFASAKNASAVRGPAAA
jgi:hypothetical protein